MASEISLEQTNQIRAALGLKLIPIPGHQQDNRDHEVQERVNRLKQTEKDPKKPTSLASKKQSLVEESMSTSVWLKRMREVGRDKRPVNDVGTETEELSVNEPAEPAASTDPAESVSVPESVPEVVAPVVQADNDAPTGDRKSSNHTSAPSKAEGYSSSKTDDATFAPTSVTNPNDYKPIKFKHRKSKTQKRRKLDHDYNLKHAAVVPVDTVTTISVPQERTPNSHEQPKKRQQQPIKIVEESLASKKQQNVTISQSLTFLKTIQESRKSETSDKTLPDTLHKSHNQLAPEIISEDLHVEQPPQQQFPLTQGLASTLSHLRSSGIVDDNPTQELRRHNRDWAKDIASKRLVRVANLEEQARSLRTTDQRLTQDRIALKEEAQIASKAFEKYNPVVDLVYKDAKGNIVTAKQAWKDLSHTFHGTPEGKKREKKRKSLG